MTFSNYNYQSVADSHKRLQELAIGDEVLIRVHSERFSLKTLKRLRTQHSVPNKVLNKFGSSAYKLDIHHNLGISQVFNAKDLICFRNPMTRLVQLYQLDFIHTVAIRQ